MLVLLTSSTKSLDRVKHWRYPTKHLCILVPAPFWHLICINFLCGADYALFWCYLGQINIQFGVNLATKFEKIQRKENSLENKIKFEEKKGFNKYTVRHARWFLSQYE